MKQFEYLSEVDQQRWARGFDQTMREYAGWAAETMQFMREKLPLGVVRRMPFGERIGQVIAPAPEVVRYIQETQN